jgi:hypothetical protein
MDLHPYDTVHHDTTCHDKSLHYKLKEEHHVFIILFLIIFNLHYFICIKNGTIFRLFWKRLHFLYILPCFSLKYAHVAKALAPLALIIASLGIISTLHVLHPLVLPSPWPNSLMDFQLDRDLELSLDSFRSAFMHMSHLFAMGFSSVVFKHLWDVFDLKDFVNILI